jgi:hypothetical protein
METLIHQETQLQATTPDQLLALAVDKNLDIDKLEKLLLMKERWDAAQARRSFFDALSIFQTKCPVLIKSKLVAFGTTKYHYAPLSDITEQIKSLLGEVGLTYRWENKTEEGKLQITCIVTHRNGHSEQTSMSAVADTSGGKNAIQSIGSTITYLQRYTLIGALGISSADEDNDGKKTEDIQKLHRDYMAIYDELIQIDKKYSNYHPDNWKGERGVKNYKAATIELSAILKKQKLNQQ